MNLPVLVLSEEAERYSRILEQDGRITGPVTTCNDSLHIPASAQDVQIVLGEPHLVAKAIHELPSLRWVQSSWAGLAPLLPAAGHGLMVSGVKEVFGAQMAEYVFGFLLDRELQIAERKSQQRNKSWWCHETGGLFGKTLGVMGTGSIGSHIARVGQAMGMNVIGLSRSGQMTEPFQQVFAVTQLAGFLGELDAVVGVLPDTPETTDLLDAKALACLPERAVVINVGRGNLIDEQALVNALQSGQIAGAVLDVFKTEPLPPDHPFWETSNLLITAHVAARSYPEDIAEIFAQNYVRFTANQPLLYQLKPEQGY